MQKKIIIFRTDRLGDYIIHSRPIYELKKKYSDSHIIVVCSRINKKILEKASYIDELIEYNKDDDLLEKFKIFKLIVKHRYFASFILDGKKFSYICNYFLRSKNKYGLSYKSFKNIFFKIPIYNPSRLYNYFFFDKVEYFTSRKYLIHKESLCLKYLNLFNDLNLKLTNKDNYIFESPNEFDRIFDDLKESLNINKYVLIHFDEKWLDILNVNTQLVENIKVLQKSLNIKIILTAYNNKFDYFLKLKRHFKYFDSSNNKFDQIPDADIVIIDNLNIFIFEKFLKYSMINISCHSGFIAQVCGANSGKILDIINQRDLNWYSCWKPENTFHRFIFKDNKKVKNDLSIIFDDIAKIVKSLS